MEMQFRVLEYLRGAREAINEIGRRNIAFVVIFSGFIYGELLGFELFDGNFHIFVVILDLGNKEGCLARHC